MSTMKEWHEKRDVVRTAFEAKLAAIDQTYEGWSNGATWQANLQITNSQSAMAAVGRLIRKSDGGIHAKKLERLMPIIIDQDFLVCPITVPAELCPWDQQYRPKIDWQEIADDLAASHRANCEA